MSQHMEVQDWTDIADDVACSGSSRLYWCKLEDSEAALVSTAFWAAILRRSTTRQFAALSSNKFEMIHLLRASSFRRQTA
jgi:hypothetical protein